MGILLSRRVSRPPPIRVIRFVPDKEVAPLTSLDELLGYKEQMLCVVEPLNERVSRGGPDDLKTLFCHDMMGGYHEDRYVQGCEAINPYRFHHWQVINTFVYYTHNFVTIPPTGWISAAHKHGVKVLGTFMLESDRGLAAINAIRDPDRLSQVAAQLAVVASLGRFDGWLVSVGCSVDADCVPFLMDLLAAIAAETHSAVPGSLVIWYDGVDARGKASPQNELDENNSSFFDLCDGIFLNFHWTEDRLQRSAQRAGGRKADVYVGIDVFARKTQYAGGYEMSQAVRTARQHGLSAAIFGAGWVYETQEKSEFAKNQYDLWDFSDDICPEWRLTAPPLCTSFCQGFGNKRFSAGERVSVRPWFNLSRQQLQPRDQGYSLCSGCGSAQVCLRDAYSGGGCLRLEFWANADHPDAVPYFRLFACDFPLGTLTVSYTFKQMNTRKSAGQDMALVLKVKTAAGETEVLSLGATAIWPNEGNYGIRREFAGVPDVSSDVAGSNWITRNYIVEEKKGTDGATVHEIGVRMFCRRVTRCLLGQLDVRRREDSSVVADADTVAGPSMVDSDDEPEDKRPRVERSEETAVVAETTEWN